MFPRRPILRSQQVIVFLATLTLLPTILSAQAPRSPAEPKPAKKSDDSLEPGVVANNVYRNKALSLTCIVPQGWVLRTDEMNARAEERKDEKDEKAAPAKTPASSDAGAKVLLAAFSRPPEAKGEEINSSILIAVERASSYPGLTEAAQYFLPLVEVAKAQGFAMDEDPYDIAIGGKTLVRGDFHKDVGTRVMRQSTLALLSHGYAISITVIAGTDDDVEDLIDGITFSAAVK